MTKATICILPQVKTTGGPSSFQSKLKAGLSARGIDTHHEISRNDTRALLITGATRNFGSLIEARHRRIRIVQRLDGMNWLHKKSKTGLRHYFRSERMNLAVGVYPPLFCRPDCVSKRIHPGLVESRLWKNKQTFNHHS